MNCANPLCSEHLNEKNVLIVRDGKVEKFHPHCAILEILGDLKKIEFDLEEIGKQLRKAKL